MPQPHFRTVVVGGGPAGLAPLVSASRDGRLDELLSGGLAIVERGPAIGSGRLGSYAITSDSTAETFLTAITGHLDPRLGQAKAHPISDRLARCGRGAVPLTDAAVLLDAVGGILADAVDVSGGAVLTGHEALEARMSQAGHWTLRLLDAARGTRREVTADSILLATGGTQEVERLDGVFVGGRSLLASCRGRVMVSDHMLRPAGLARLRARLTGRSNPKVVIVGGSTSALAAASLLLRRCGDLLAAPGSITILHRRPLRVFYPSAAAAIADDYTDFGPDDICPLSGFVYRLAGFRLESRELVMQLLGVGGRPPEPRVALQRLDLCDDASVQSCLASADVVVAATGYRPRGLTVRDVSGANIPLRGHIPGQALVDRTCRVCDVNGRPLPGLFGIGLAAGFVPRGALGGEASFRGQTNGLWLWQTAIGAMVVDGLLNTPRSLEQGPARSDGDLRVPALWQSHEHALSPG